MDMYLFALALGGTGLIVMAITGVAHLGVPGTAIQAVQVVEGDDDPLAAIIRTGGVMGDHQAAGPV